MRTKLKSKKPRGIAKGPLGNDVGFDKDVDCLFCKLTEADKFHTMYVIRNQNYTMELQEHRKKSLSNFDVKRKFWKLLKVFLGKIWTQKRQVKFL